MAQETPGREELVELRHLLAERFNREELRGLCFDLGVDYDSLPAEGKANKARELVSYLERYERIPELVARIEKLRPAVHRGDTSRTAAEASPAPITRHNLPPRRLYVERDHYVDQVMELLRASNESDWIVGISGLAGTGKTTLALEVAHRCREQCLFDALIWATAEQEVLTTRGRVRRTHSLTSIDSLYDEIAQTLDHDEVLKLESVQEKRAAVRSIVKEHRCLLVIDNVENLGGWRLIEGLRDFVQPTKIVVTSRPKVGTPDRAILLEGLGREPALELMRAECRAKEVTADTDVLLTLCERAGGIPLALVWCIGLMSELPVGRVVRQMHKVEGDLLKYCFANARQELSSEADRVLCAGALFAASAGYDALHAVCGIESEDTFDDGLCQLVRLSLINREEGDRYSLLPLTRAFVYGEMEQRELDEAVRLRHVYADYFLRFAEQHNSRSREDLSILRTEHENIRKAFNWCKDQEDDLARRMLPRFATALHNFHQLSGYWNELVEWHALAFRVSTDLQDWSQVGHHAYAMGFIRFQQGNFDEAERWSGEAISAVTRAGDEYQRARVQRLPAMVARARGDYQASRQWLDNMRSSGEKLLETAVDDETVGKIKGDLLADALITRANLECELKNYPTARRLYEEALAIHKELGDVEKMGLNLNHLGRVDLAEYDQAMRSDQRDAASHYLALAEAHFTEGRQVSEMASRADQILIGMWGQARVAEERGEYNQAWQLAQEALKHYAYCGAAEISKVRDLLKRVAPVP
jgi:tetratricopeptide (TPR) repeat protein